MTAARFLALVLLFAFRLAGQAPASEDAIWKHFFTWYQDSDPRTATPDAYRARLVSEGLTEAQAGERMALIQKLAGKHELDLTALNFNRAYTAPVAPFNTKPNAFLVSVSDGLKPGTALDVAMGQGRNALYLAGKGWQVTGFDIAEKGLESAQAQAAKQGLKLTTVKSTYEDFDFGKERWDLIVFSYAWVPIAAPELVERIRASLKPGGVVVIEHPVLDPLAEKPEWKPTAADEVNTLAKVWTNGFRLLRFEDTEDQCDWRNRKARVLRLFARKWQ